MNKGKGYNQIVFLTTLSVYLGLVLVGSTPQVLAQTSKTIASTSSQSLREYSSSDLQIFRLENFLRKIKSEVALGHIDLAKPVHLKFQSAFDRGALVPDSLRLQLEAEDSAALEALLKEFFAAVDESNLFRALVDEAKGQSVKGANLEIFHKLDATTFDFSIKTDSPQTAQKLAGGFDGLFAVVKRIRKDYPEVKFYENATIRFENDQVFIVTRMPRAALEAFLTDRNR